MMSIDVDGFWGRSLSLIAHHQWLVNHGVNLMSGHIWKSGAVEAQGPQSGL